MSELYELAVTSGIPLSDFYSRKPTVSNVELLSTNQQRCPIDNSLGYSCSHLGANDEEESINNF